MSSRYLQAFAASVLLHLLLVAAVAWQRDPLPAQPSDKASRTIAAFVVAPTEDSTFPGLKPVAKAEADWTVPRGMEGSTLELGTFNVDVSKISERARVLFPFLTPGIALETFALLPHEEARSTLVNPFAVQGRRAADDAAPPLAAGEAALQSLVDRSWSRHGRWAAFEPISRLARAHNPSTGQLPALLRMYCDQNSLQPYTDTNIRDPRLWAQLGLAADHVTFIAFIRQYASDHPSTRATTELLFLLDRIAEANRDALRVLLTSDPGETLGWTRAGSPKAFELVVRIRWHYQREVDRRGLGSEEAITVFYDNERLAILNGIVRTTPGGYRANDARFLIGAIYWSRQQLDEALRAWREMSVDPEDTHIVGSAQLAQALRNASGRTDAGALPDAALIREIERVLKNEHGRWVDFSYDRLKRFGYRFDSF